MLFLTLVLYTFLQAPQEHDIHVSVCDINLENNEIEITFKTFLDDLQLAVGLTPGQKLPENYSSSDEMISDYILSNSSLQINDLESALSISSIDAASDAVWITIIAEHPQAKISTIEWHSTFLTELYADQTNIVNLKYQGKRKVFTLDKKKVNTYYTFQK